MNKQEFAPFYVGQEVEAVVDSVHGFFKKGDRLIVHELKKGCRCGGWIVSWGQFYQNVTLHCDTCKWEDSKKSNFLFLKHSLFRAITPAMQAVAFEKITEQHPVSVN